MAHLYDFDPSNHAPEIELYPASHGVEFNTPVIRLVETDRPDVNFGMVAVTFDRMFFSQSREECIFGWYLASDRFLDAVEPLSIAEALRLVVLDMEDPDPIMSFVMEVWVDTAHSLGRLVKEEAETLELEYLRSAGLALKDITREIAELAVVHGMTGDEFVESDGRIDLDADKLREWTPRHAS